MKRFLSVFLSLCLALSCLLGLGITANAETTLMPDTDGNANSDTPMSVQGMAISEPTYTVQIPTKVDFGNIQRTKESNIETQPVKIMASNISHLFENQQKLVVTVSSANVYKLSDGAAKPNMLSYNFYTAYTDETTNTPLSNGLVLEMVGTADSDTALTKTVNGAITVDTADIKKAGTYSDILTFTVALQEVNV